MKTQLIKRNLLLSVSSGGGRMDQVGGDDDKWRLPLHFHLIIRDHDLRSGLDGESGG